MKTSTSVNAGSMADIAFLMLIFFLTTTTIETDKGLSQTLPDPCKTEDCATELAERNLLIIKANRNGAYLVNGELTAITEIAQQVTRFVMNTENAVNRPESPANAVVNLDISRELNYKTYVEVFDQVKKAYAGMRSDFSRARFSKIYNELTQAEAKVVLDAFPLQISETALEKI